MSPLFIDPMLSPIYTGEGSDVDTVVLMVAIAILGGIAGFALGMAVSL